MSLFGAAMGDFDDDPFFGSHMRQMRHVNQMMNSLFASPFGMGMMPDMGGPLSIMGPHHAHSSMMPFMPQMNMNRLMTGGLHNGFMGGMGNSYSSVLVTSNGPDGRPLVYSSTSSTQLGPDGVKETRRTVQDSRTGTKKMSIGHHIHDRAHLIEREQDVTSGDLEERQEFINIEEEEVDEFNREFEERSKKGTTNASNAQILPRSAPLLALTAPPTSSSTGAGVRHTYSSLHPQRSKQRGHKSHHNTSDY